jgi:hypothetical protein
VQNQSQIAINASKNFARAQVIRYIVTLASFAGLERFKPFKGSNDSMLQPFNDSLK